MSAVRAVVRRGAYYDSIVLLRLQQALAALPGIRDAGVAMASETNREILQGNDLWPAAAADAGPGDLVVAVAADDDGAAAAALERVDELLARRSSDTGSSDSGDDYRPRSLSAALRSAPAARWVMVSVPGRWAGGVAREALAAGRNVFLYSDNVPLEEEVELKRRAAAAGLLVLGPDCGTAWVGGVGLGFANRVRRGSVGLVSASGTGLQAVACGLDALGAGVSHGLGTGGRDLSDEVGGATALAGLRLLAADAATRVIVLLGKPPAPPVARRLLAAAWQAGKPVVVHFIGQAPPARRLGPLRFAADLADAAELAAAAAADVAASDAASDARAPAPRPAPPAAGRRWLRALFSGGTLAYELLQGLAALVAPLASNLSLPGVEPAQAGGGGGGAHSVLDLGEDEYTRGRVHPMVDQELRRRLLLQAADDPAVALVAVDVVLGLGADPDPAGALASGLERCRRAGIATLAVLVGTPDDPQELAAQHRRLADAGAAVVPSAAEAAAWIAARLPMQPIEDGAAAEEESPESGTALDEMPAVVNVGLESFYRALREQGAEAVQMEWRPPAGGDEKLQALLAKMS